MTTPGSWRMAAAGLLAGGLLAGQRAAGGGLLGWLGRIAGIVTLLAVGPLIAASRRVVEPVSNGQRDPEMTFSVIVAARDEAPVIGRVIGDLGAQDHRAADGRPLFELLIVDDRSTDGTGQVALRAAADAGLGEVTRYIPRGGPDLPDGKGAALTAAQPDQCHGDVVVVLDADARIGPSFLRRLALYASDQPAVTARRRIMGAEESHLAGAQADEQTADGLIQRGRWALGGCSEFRGDGITIRRDLLETVGGWRAEALTEDLDLTSRVGAATGHRVAWAREAEVWEEPVRRWSDLWRQRQRWAEGAVRRLFEHGPAVLQSDRLSATAKADFAIYASQLVLAPFLAGVALGSLRRGAVGPVVAIGGPYLVAGGVLGWESLRWETTRDGEPLPAGDRAWRAARVAAFGLIWLAAVPAALWRLATREGPVRYDKMAHGGGESPLSDGPAN